MRHALLRQVPVWVVGCAVAFCVPSPGLADTVNRFCIQGDSDAVGWSWRVTRISDGAVLSEDLNAGTGANTVPAGEKSDLLAQEFVRSINAAGGGVSAQHLSPGDGDHLAGQVCRDSAAPSGPCWEEAFAITVTNSPFNLSVGGAGLPPTDCTAAIGTVCNFNPELVMGSPPPGQPALGRRGQALLAGLVLLAGAALILGRRWIARGSV